MASARHSRHHRKQALKKLNQVDQGYLPQRQKLGWKFQQYLGDCQHPQGELQDFIATLVEFYSSPLAVISLETNRLLLTNCRIERLCDRVIAVPSGLSEKRRSGLLSFWQGQQDLGLWFYQLKRRIAQTSSRK